MLHVRPFGTFWIETNWWYIDAFVFKTIVLGWYHASTFFFVSQEVGSVECFVDWISCKLIDNISAICFVEGITVGYNRWTIRICYSVESTWTQVFGDSDNLVIVLILLE